MPYEEINSLFSITVDMKQVLDFIIIEA